MIEGIGKVHPVFVSLLAKWEAENAEMLLKVIKNQMTIGEWNTAHNRMLATRNREWAHIETQIVQQLETAHAYEIQQREAAASALQQWAYQQQLLQQNQQVINSLNRPTFVNCQYDGDFVQCTGF